MKELEQLIDLMRTPFKYFDAKLERIIILIFEQPKETGIYLIKEFIRLWGLPLNLKKEEVLEKPSCTEEEIFAASERSVPIDLDRSCHIFHQGLSLESVAQIIYEQLEDLGVLGRYKNCKTP